METIPPHPDTKSYPPWHRSLSLGHCGFPHHFDLAFAGPQGPQILALSWASWGTPASPSAVGPRR